ncbi:hypothetical protein J8281_13615 [Aquimarina sp. U1-2]|uniref:hypothetical protein n=1 Tax=Aquimarina sp. U1-2 TaxID=2823141 RepID=UPI001AED0244|nr:hypothetical protein [Aquimarina sp. U1-2]MBP2833226.1 hypothetical protein [Aquimarina sp. U1-2]
MYIELCRLLFDFGLLVLIWVVQLVVYPSFEAYSKDNLIKWHKKYVNRIAIVVMPLMVGQLSFVIVQVFKDITIIHIISLVLVSMTWASTFLQFVPIHNDISFGFANKQALRELIKKNWLRTLLWTVIFCISLYQWLS